MHLSRQMPWKTFAVFFISILLISCGERSSFTDNDIEHTQKFLQLNFTEQEIDSMRAYLERIHEGFPALREKTIDNSVSPVLYFDPHPDQFEFNDEEQQSINWPYPEDITRPMDERELAYLSVPELATLIRTRQLTSVELTRLYLERIKKYDDTLKAVVTLLPEHAMEQARKADEEISAGRYKGPLHGIPYGVKDLLALADHPTTWGAEPYKDQLIQSTATVIQKLEEAGAVLVAKLVSGELANGDIWFGGRTKNPWDLEQGASGSSAGPGSATAAGLVGFSIGTETWGSIVSPSARCGITGLRPTYGRVSRYGCMTLSWSLDKIGPMCRSALGAAMVLDAIHGQDPRDRSTITQPFNYVPSLDTSLSIGYLHHAFAEDTTELGTLGMNALNTFRELGYQLDSMRLPANYPTGPMMYQIIRGEAGAAFEQLVMENKDDLLANQKSRSRANSLRVSYFMPAVAYINSNRLRKGLIQSMDSLMQQYDVIIAYSKNNRHSEITNMTGHPVITVPTGLDDIGRPTNMVLIGKLYDEATIIELARQYQEATDFDEQHPPAF